MVITKKQIMPKFILASQSERRLQLLSQINIVPDMVIPADIYETPHKAEHPKDYVERVSTEKALKVAKDYPEDIILAGDTSVVLGRDILGKPKDAAEAASFLRRLSGRRHQLLGGLALYANKSVRAKVVTTLVKFKSLTAGEIEAYIASGEWKDRAGAYSIQDYAACFVEKIIGSYTNVVGLSLRETHELLRCVPGLNPLR